MGHEHAPLDKAWVDWDLLGAILLEPSAVLGSTTIAAPNPQPMTTTLINTDSHGNSRTHAVFPLEELVEDRHAANYASLPVTTELSYFGT